MTRDLRRARNRRSACVLLGAGLLVVATACSGNISAEITRPLNTSDVEAQITEDLAQNREVEVTVVCPEDVEAEADGLFTCTATDSDGNSLEIRVTQTDDSGHVDYNLAMLNLALIETQVASQVTQEVGVSVTLECPRILVSSEKGSSVDCRATDAKNGTGIVRVTTKDDQGHLDWELNP